VSDLSIWYVFCLAHAWRRYLSTCILTNIQLIEKNNHQFNDYNTSIVIHIQDGSIFLMNINEFRITYALPTYLCKVKHRNNIDQSYVYVDNFWEKCRCCRCLILILVKKAEKRKANDEPTDPETPRNKDLKYDREKRTRTFQKSWIVQLMQQKFYNH
jgi:hypothetical protein